MTLKKHIASCLAVLYLILSSGIVVNLHYCCGELETISMVTNDTGCNDDVAISCCGAVEVDTATDDKGCCDDDVINLNDSDVDTVLVTHNGLDLFVGVSQLQEAHVVAEVIQLTQAALPHFTYQSNAPPLYKLYCTYIHYA